MEARRMSCAFVMCIFLGAFCIGPSSSDNVQIPDGAEAEPEAKTLRLSLKHAKAHASPDTKLPTFTDLVHRDRRRIAARGASQSAAWPRNNGRQEKEKDGGAFWVASTLRGRGALDTPLNSDAPAGVAQYVVDFEFGTPPTKSVLVVDTGSDLLWTQCLYKSQNKHTNGSFLADKSSTFVPVRCHTSECRQLPSSSCSSRLRGLCGYDYSYADGTVAHGILAFDRVSVNGVGINSTPLGCTDAAQGDILSGAQGVLGLGQGAVSFVSSVRHLYGDKFSYCFVDHLTNPTSSNFLVFGDRRSSERLQSIPLLPNPNFPTFYFVRIRSLTVGGTDLFIPNDAWQINSDGSGGTIFDSGTSLTFLVPRAFNALLAAFDKLLPKPRVRSDTFPICFKNTGVKHPYPQLVITFDGGARFIPPTNNYIFETDSGVSCLAILESTSESAGNTIGNILQQNFIVEYDRRNSQLRFAQTDCSKN